MHSLLSRQDWHDRQVLAFIDERFETFFGDVGAPQRRLLFKHFAASDASQQRLAELLKGLHRDIQGIASDLLAIELGKTAGYPIDPHSATLRTWATARGKRALAEHDSQPVLIGKTLWEAFRDSLVRDNRSPAESALNGRSYLADAAGERLPNIEAADFQAIIDRLDLKQQVDELLATQLNSTLAKPLLALLRAQLDFDLVYSHCRHVVTAKELPGLTALVEADSAHWTMHALNIDGLLLIVPFFVHRRLGADGDPVFSYFPERPSGAWQRHPSLQSAREALLGEIRDSAGAGDLGWLLRQMALLDQQRLSAYLGTPEPDLGELNWLARQLHRLFADHGSGLQRLQLEEHTQAPMSLVMALRDERKLRIYRDMGSVLTSHYSARRTLQDSLAEIVSETLELLLLPVPGGLLGAGKLVLSALLGSLAYQTAAAFLARQNGDNAQWVQALSDIADLLISARLSGVGMRLSQRRLRALIRQLGEPRRHSPGQGADGLTWTPEPDAAWQTEHLGLADSDLLSKMLGDDQRLDAAVRQRVLRIAHCSRADLDGVWDGHQATPPLLHELLQAERLRREFDALRQALDSEADWPPLGVELVPALLADEIGREVVLVEEADLATAAAHSPSSLRLVHVGQQRYRGAEGGAPIQSLLEAAVLAHDYLAPDLPLGKTGDFSTDASLASRARQVRQQLSARLQREQPAYFAEWLQRRRDQALASSALTAGPSALRTRAALALASLADPLNRIAPRDAVHVAFAVLVSLPGWPAQLGINLFQGTPDRNANIIPTLQLLQSYGAADASAFIAFAHADGRLAGVDQTHGDPIASRAIDYGLADLILRSLTDPQRSALGLAIVDAARLSETLLDLALLERDELETLFAPPQLTALTDTRLQAFRAGIDFDGALPDSQGLLHHAGRHYVRIGAHHYQVVQDHQASLPRHPVQRIVRAEDAVAQGPDNRYIASRPGRSEPIMRDDQGHWQGVLTGLVGGMPPKRQSARVSQATRVTRQQAMQRLLEANQRILAAEQNLAQPAQAMRRHDVQVNVAVALDNRASTPATQERMARAVAERVEAIPPFRERTVQLIAALDDKALALDAFETTLLPSNTETRALFVGEFRGLLVKRIAQLDQLILCDDLLVTAQTQHLRDHPFDHRLEFIRHRTLYLQRMNDKLEQARQREADEDQLRTRFAGGDVEERLERLNPGKPINSYYVKVAQVQFLCDLLTTGELAGREHWSIRPIYLAKDFMENAIALRTLDELRADQRVALIDGIQREFENLHAAFEALKSDYPDGSMAGHLSKVLGIVEEFEQRSADELLKELAQRDEASPPERLTDDIDLAFLPVAANRPRPAPRANKRVIKIKRRGVDALAVGEIQVEDNQEQVAVIAHDSGKVVQRYRRNEQGQWQRSDQPSTARPAEAPPSAALAQARLADIEQHLAQADAMNRRQDNPTNIVEYLERQADELLEQARQLPEQAEALTQGAARLTDAGRQIMIGRYKDPQVLDVHRLLFLLEQREVTVTRVENRLERGKGKHRYYLDVYAIRDARTAADLWHAHFHYPDKDSALTAYPIRGGHLKTLEQSRLGREHQQRQEQAGLPVERIWRQELDRKSAARLFALAERD